MIGMTFCTTKIASIDAVGGGVSAAHSIAAEDRELAYGLNAIKYILVLIKYLHLLSVNVFDITGGCLKCARGCYYKDADKVNMSLPLWYYFHVVKVSQSMLIFENCQRLQCLLWNEAQKKR